MIQWLAPVQLCMCFLVTLFALPPDALGPDVRRPQGGEGLAGPDHEGPWGELAEDTEGPRELEGAAGVDDRGGSMSRAREGSVNVPAAMAVKADSVGVWGLSISRQVRSLVFGKS